MKTLTRVHTQVFENYGNAKSPHWKPKGGHEFTVMIDDALLMYDEPRCLKAFIDLVAAKSGAYMRFEFINHEPIFDTPEPLCTDQEFEDKILAIWKAEPKDPDQEPDDVIQEQIDMLRDK
jgi:hypothetical protein